MEKKKASLIYGLLVLLLIEMGIWGILHYRGEELTETSLSSVLEEAINRALLSSGIKETNLVKKYWKETSNEKGGKWVKVYEEFVVSPSTSLNEVLRSIDEKITRSGGKILSYNFLDKGKGLKISLGKGERVTHSLFIAKKKAPRISIIIDDVGYGGKIEEEILKIPYPLNISILPSLENSRRMAEVFHRSGFEVMLHLPLESKNLRYNRGPGFITTDMSGEEILLTLNKNLRTVPYAVGVNNHEGSRAMTEERIMSEIMSFLKKKELFFVDSLTTPNSCAKEVAMKEKVPYRARDIFLDNKREEKYIEEQLWELVSQSLSHGQAIGIGHPYPETISVLRRILPKIEAEGIDIVRLSKLIENES